MNNESKQLTLHKLYLAAYTEEIKTAISEFRKDEGLFRPSNIVKIVWLGVKVMSMLQEVKSKEHATINFGMIATVKNNIGLLTLEEFMNIFPIAKIYDGRKFGYKDYYYTLETIERMGLKPNEYIGDRALEFIVEYMNVDLIAFNSQGVRMISAIRRYEGHLDFIEEFEASLGNETPNTFKNGKGEVMYVRKGKTVKLDMAAQPTSHLKLVK